MVCEAMSERLSMAVLCRSSDLTSAVMARGIRASGLGVKVESQSYKRGVSLICLSGVSGRRDLRRRRYDQDDDLPESCSLPWELLLVARSSAQGPLFCYMMVRVP